MMAPAVYASLRGLTAVRCSRKLRQSIAELPSGSLWLVSHRAHRHVPRIVAVWGWFEEAFAGGA